MTINECEKVLSSIKNDKLNIRHKSTGYGIVEIAEWLINELKAADVQPINQWISCKDKMPDDGVNVLIYAGNRMISLAWYDKDMGYFYICDSDYKYNSLDVTHWRPLPKPPVND